MTYINPYDNIAEIQEFENNTQMVNHHLSEGWVILKLQVEKVMRYKPIVEGEKYQSYEVMVTKVVLGRRG